jgi:acyl-coenzyme A synthetase/AMP-(fatty) acid ligase
MEAWSRGRTLINSYGPTEATVFVSMHTFVSGDANNNIGKPINNTRFYVLDTSLNPVPIGAIGELHIGGAGLARGYLHKPELTAERFISNPFATLEDKAKGYTRLYKTGDLVCWSADGNIEYIGRNDFQVKLRGFRIELGEIETILCTHPSIDQVVVLAKESQGNKYLVAYYVADTELNHEDLTQYLLEKLPEYMTPNAYVRLDKLPMTINGKLDRHALPDPELISKEKYTAPSNELEAKLCLLWKKY